MADDNSSKPESTGRPSTTVHFSEGQKPASSQAQPMMMSPGTRPSPPKK